MRTTIWSIALVLVCGSLHAQTAPQQINYQCKVEKAGVPFDGVGQFKFAIVDQTGTNTYWSNDGTSTGGAEPSNSVALNAQGGLLAVPLGNAAIPNMTVIPASVFEQQDRHVRIWFGGKAGSSFERLRPDNPVSSVPYALVAQSVPDDTITGRKLTRESVWPVHEGRDNTIVSYYAEFTGAAGTTVATISSNKNFIITDISFGSLGDYDANMPSADVLIKYNKDGKDTILYKKRIAATRGTDSIVVTPYAVHYRSGLVVPAGATLWIGGFATYSWPHAKSCEVAGFEIPVE